MKFKTIFSTNTLELAIRIWTAFFICIYGFAKSIQFNGSNLPNTPINEAHKMEIMWAFFGTTTTYPVIIGVLQILGAILLILKPTKLLGAVILTPIFLNIIVLDILYDVHKGALINAVIFQLVLLFVIVRHRKLVLASLKNLLLKPNKDAKGEQIVLFTIASVVAIFLFFIYQIIIKL